MKKIFSAIFLIAIATGIVHAQESASSILYAGLSVSPLISHRSVSEPEFDNESAIISYRAGIPVTYRFSPRLSLETGLHYSVHGEKSPLLYYSYYNGTTYVDSGSVQFTYLYRFLDMPVKANIFFLKKESGSGLYFSGGICISFFLSHTQISIHNFNGTSTEKKENRSDAWDFNKVNISWNVGIGWEKVLNDKLKMRISPEYQRNLLPIANEPVKRYFYTLGINFGLFKTL